MPGIKIVVGLVGLSDTSTMKEALSVLEAHGVKNIDTAHLYGRGQNEIDIGNAGGGDGRFIIDSKNRGGWTPGVALERAEMLKTAREGLAKLKPLKQLDVFYIHAPDATKRLEEWVPTIQELHDEGLFRLFGLSNFSAEQVKEVYDFCKAKGYILPGLCTRVITVRSPRKQEQLLFPYVEGARHVVLRVFAARGRVPDKDEEAVARGHWDWQVHKGSCGRDIS